MKLLETTSRSHSQNPAATTVSTSATSHEHAEVMSAPRKPQRSKSGCLDTPHAPDVSAPLQTSSSRRKKEAKSSLASATKQRNDGEVEDKWCALNDSKPDTVRRRVRRIIRSNSDSDMSEASTIDSGAGMSAKGTTRKKGIQLRKEERKARQSQRKEAKDAKSSEGHHGDEDLEEDDELVDTDKDLPISEELELALRKKRMEARRSTKNKRGKSPHIDHSGRVRSNRRGGKKEDVLSSPSSNAGEDRSYAKSLSTKRANSLDGAPRRHKHQNLDALTADDSPEQRTAMARCASADRISKSDALFGHMSASSGFNMLLDDCHNDSMLRNIPNRPVRKSLRHQNTSPHKNISTDDDYFIADVKEQGYTKASRFGSPQSRLSKVKLSKSEITTKSGKQHSDRFLCPSKTSDFAPRISSRLNILDDDDATQETSTSERLEHFLTEERSKVRKMKKGGAKSVDDAPTRRSPKQLRQ